MKKLYCIYSCQPEHIVLEMDGPMVVREFKTKAPSSQFGIIRGGTQPIPHRGLWLRFVHSHQESLGVVPQWKYHILALMMESTPPFSIVSVSKKPIITAGDQFYYGWKFFKPRIVFPAGAVKNGDSFDVSYGCNDSAMMIAKLRESDLNL